MGAAPIIESLSNQVDERNKSKVNQSLEQSVLRKRIEEKCDNVAGSQERISLRTHVDPGKA